MILHKQNIIMPGRLILILFLIYAFCSCGSDNRNIDDETVLEFWQFWTDPRAKKVITDLINEFEEINPDIRINVTDLTWGEGHSKIVVAFSSGRAPDIIELGSDWIPEFSSRDCLTDITGYLGELLLERIMWEPVIYNDVYYAMPWFLDTRVIFYNRNLYNKEDYPENWVDFANACKAVNNRGEKIAGFGANCFEKHRLYKKFLPFVWSNNGDVLNGLRRPVLDSHEVLEAFKFYLKLVNSGVIDNQRNLDTKFIKGELGFNFSGGWLLKNIELNNPDLNFGVMPVPSPTGGIGTSFAGGEYLAVSSSCKHPDKAVKFIKFLIKPENAVKLCKAAGFGFPSTRDFPDDPFYTENPHRRIFHKQLLNSRTPPVHPQWVYIEEVIEKAVEKGMYNKARPVELLKEANSEIKRILKKSEN